MSRGLSLCWGIHQFKLAQCHFVSFGPLTRKAKKCGARWSSKFGVGLVLAPEHKW